MTPTYFYLNSGFILKCVSNNLVLSLTCFEKFSRFSFYRAVSLLSIYPFHYTQHLLTAAVAITKMRILHPKYFLQDLLRVVLCQKHLWSYLFSTNHLLVVVYYYLDEITLHLLYLMFDCQLPLPEILEYLLYASLSKNLDASLVILVYSLWCDLTY